MMVMEKGAKQSNLESFIYSVTPVVQSDCLSKTKITNFRYPFQTQEMEYYKLRDFWYSFYEISSYGIGVPITLENGRKITQYYEPSLSAMEIYTSNFYAHPLSENIEGAVEMMSDSSCDEGVKRLGYSYFQFFEQSSPYARYPLIDKVYDLSQTFPGLMSLSSVDLSPASWMSVAWYPIYNIPMGNPNKDISTCFLTYHTLSSSFLDAEADADADADAELKDENEKVKVEKKEVGGGLRLPPFGLATHKLQGNLWISGEKDKEKLVSMLGVADSWLKQLTVDHHDFNYFTANYRS